MDQPKMECLLRLLKMLTANDTLMVDDIARHMDISPRTVIAMRLRFERRRNFIYNSNDCMD